MRAAIAVAALAIFISPALADAGTFGDAEACRAKGPAVAPAGYDGPLFFDGTLIYGPAWSCDLKGACEGEDGPGWRSKVKTKVSGAGIRITIDGRAFTLPRCQ